jgi:dolichyl-phosphate beta-glucosyltransferase
MRQIYLSVIIPCYNEEENLKRDVLEEVYSYFENKKFTWEVLISDDGSTDKSRSLIKETIKSLTNFKLLENPHGGKPSTLLYGIKTARGKHILFTDMDQSTPIKELDKLLPKLDSQVGAVIGSRGLTRKNFPLYRRIGAIVFASIRRFLILPELKDTQCGFKLFRSDVLRKVFPKLEFFKVKRRTKGWLVSSYDVELLHMIKKQGLAIKEVLVLWKDRDVSTSKGGSLKKYVRESKEMIAQILRVKINDLKGMYKF